MKFGTLRVCLEYGSGTIRHAHLFNPSPVVVVPPYDAVTLSNLLNRRARCLRNVDERHVSDGTLPLVAFVHFNTAEISISARLKRRVLASERGAE